MNSYKCLFICKQRAQNKYGSFGLMNSAKFVSDYINNYITESKVIQVVDGNSLDKEVTIYNPQYIFIEALWVTPEKIKELLSMNSHKNRKWIIRIHSKFSFLANEGIALKWINEYSELMKQFSNLYIAPNTEEMTKFLKSYYNCENFIYLPNVYQKEEKNQSECTISHDSSVINIGCFGAIRPLKNQLIQAIAAIEFAKMIGKDLHFHMNKHNEQAGDQVYKNIKNLFDYCQSNVLVEHEWLNHKDFLELIYRMDIGMQVSYSESYNIVTADFISMDVPIVTSNEVKFVMPFCKTSPNSILLIKLSLYLNYVLAKLKLHKFNKLTLAINTFKSKKVWKKFLTK